MLPGFRGFLKAKTFSQLAPAAYEGPVVILNIDKSRSDALVLITDDSKDKCASVVNIPLIRFSYERGQTLREKLTSLLTLSGFRPRARRDESFPDGMQTLHSKTFCVPSG